MTTFVGGIRTQLGLNATWPFIALAISSVGVRVRLRMPFLAWALPGLDEEIYLWGEIGFAELAGLGPVAIGIRFEADRGHFVFWSYRPREVLRSVEAHAPEGIVRWGRPRTIGLFP